MNPGTYPIPESPQLHQFRCCHEPDQRRAGKPHRCNVQRAREQSRWSDAVAIADADGAVAREPHPDYRGECRSDDREEASDQCQSNRRQEPVAPTSATTSVTTATTGPNSRHGAMSPRTNARPDTAVRVAGRTPPSSPNGLRPNAAPAVHPVTRRWLGWYRKRAGPL